MKKLFVLVALLIGFDVFCGGLYAQSHGMHIEVQADRVMIGNEFVPRFLDLPSTFVVAANEPPKTIPPGTYDYIEIGGVATIAGAVNATHVIVLPGGVLTLQCGATLTGRNVPINTARDPFQWGNGLVSFGSLRSVCPDKTPFVQIAAAPAGATTITLQSSPAGWDVGDDLIIPDTRQVTTASQPRREAPYKIMGISGSVVTLSRPLGFARDSIKRPDGSVVKLPEVANITRRTVVKSENPDGVRWHLANVGADASWDIVSTAFVEMGRTKPIPLSNTSLGSGVGTNQVGRYGGLHNHHNGSSLAVRRANDNAFFTTRTIAKWGGIILHQTHDTENIGNVCVGFNSCFVTEDGNEVRNVFRGNWAAFGPGTGVGGEVALNNVRANNPGAESCYWFRGVHNIFEGNHAWNCQSGIDLFNFGGLQPGDGVPVPTVKGGPATLVMRLDQTVPISFDGNMVAANTDAGLVHWQLVRYENTNMVSVHNALKAMWNAQPNGKSEAYLIDPVLVNSGGIGNAIASSTGYNFGVEVLRGEMRGFQVALVGGLGAFYGRITDTAFQNTADFSAGEGGWAAELTFTRVRTTSPTFFEWTVKESAATDGRQWALFRGTNAPLLTDWNGTANDYRLVQPINARSTPAPRSASPWDWAYPPIECGATLGDVWDKCGFSYGGAPHGAEAVALPGIVGMVAVPEPRASQNGVPRAVLTSPRNDVSPYPIRLDYGFHILSFALVGDPNAADNQAYFSVNNGPRMAAGSLRPDWAWLFFENPPDGPLTIRAWREKNGAEVPGSAVTFSGICLKNCGGTPPPPPPPDPPVNCQLSATSSAQGQWSLSGTTYTRTTTETKTILTAPANGGTPCQP